MISSFSVIGSIDFTEFIILNVLNTLFSWIKMSIGADIDEITIVTRCFDATQQGEDGLCLENESLAID